MSQTICFALPIVPGATDADLKPAWAAKRKGGASEAA